jgi:16S rRNA (guanine527-N7)-methyltransferase
MRALRLKEPRDMDLVVGAGELGIDLDPGRAAQLIELLVELDVWNERINLTAIRDRRAQVAKHLLDSLALQPFLRGERFVDVGTGAGFPGLPLAFVNPDRHFTLLDSTAKKLAFVEHAASVLGLTNVVTVHARAEAWTPPQRFDAALARALGPLDRIAPWCAGLLVPGGRLLAMKGRFPEDELAQLPPGWRLVAAHRLDVPGLDEERHLVELCRTDEKA